VRSNEAMSTEFPGNDAHGWVAALVKCITYRMPWAATSDFGEQLLVYRTRTGDERRLR
jgi:hypothetical protein